MNSKIIGYIGIGTYILSVLSSVTDLEGNSTAPAFLIVISGISLITFVILATTRLWKTNKVLAIILSLSALFEMFGGIIALSPYQEYGSPYVIITNIASIIFFLTRIWAIVLLFRLPKISDVKPKQPSDKPEKKMENITSKKNIGLSNDTETREEPDLTPASDLFINEQIVNIEEEKERIPIARKVNWESVQEARKQTGDFGEAIVVEYERAFLLKQGKRRLSKKVSLVSSKNLGYDVFSKSDDGSNRYIEVKSFAKGKACNFIVTRNELNFMRANPESSFVYMVTDCDSEPKILKMSARQFFKLKLKPSTFKITL